MLFRTTKCLYFQYKKNTGSSSCTDPTQPGISLTLAGSKFEIVPDYKYLAVTLDNKLDFSTHIRLVLKNASHQLHKLSRVRKYISRETCLQLYTAYILSTFDYGDAFYESATKVILIR